MILRSFGKTGAAAILLGLAALDPTVLTAFLLPPTGTRDSPFHHHQSRTITTSLQSISSLTSYYSSDFYEEPTSWSDRDIFPRSAKFPARAPQPTERNRIESYDTGGNSYGQPITPPELSVGRGNQNANPNANGKTRNERPYRTVRESQNRRGWNEGPRRPQPHQRIHEQSHGHHSRQPIPQPDPSMGRKNYDRNFGGNYVYGRSNHPVKRRYFGMGGEWTHQEHHRERQREQRWGFVPKKERKQYDPPPEQQPSYATEGDSFDQPIPEPETSVGWGSTGLRYAGVARLPESYETENEIGNETQNYEASPPLQSYGTTGSNSFGQPIVLDHQKSSYARASSNGLQGSSTALPEPVFRPKHYYVPPSGQSSPGPNPPWIGASGRIGATKGSGAANDVLPPHRWDSGRHSDVPIMDHHQNSGLPLGPFDGNSAIGEGVGEDWIEDGSESMGLALDDDVRTENDSYSYREEQMKKEWMIGNDGTVAAVETIEDNDGDDWLSSSRIQLTVTTSGNARTVTKPANGKARPGRNNLNDNGEEEDHDDDSRIQNIININIHIHNAGDATTIVDDGYYEEWMTEQQR